MRMKYKVDEWVMYDQFPDNLILSSPERAVILHVSPKSDRSYYDYEIYIDEAPGKYKKVRESELYPMEK
tara:strand:+ start:1035 stop:1241 length:207 start_codon:yes stop_codon:yes gene_type:complete